MRRALPILCAIVLVAGTAIPASRRGAHRPVLHEVRQRFLSKRALAGAAVAAGYGQARNRPHEWGQGGAGFAKRFGSAFGTHAVKAGIEMDVGHWLHEDLHYQRSNLHGTWPRMKYALKGTFIVPRTSNRPGKTLAAGRIAGAFGAGLISRAWQPASTAGIGAGFASGGISLGADTGFNMAREFWPRKNHGRKIAARRRWRTRR